MEVHPLAHYKSKYLLENEHFKEIQPSADSATIGKFQSINEEEEELWFLQCPKGMDITQLEDQKLKLPGRSTINDIEVVAVEATNDEEHAFGYCNRKGRYALRILPVRGSIIMRNKLKASDTVTMEKIQTCCPPKSRVPAPEFIKVRHPLFGVAYDEKLKIPKSIQKKLILADDNSTRVMHEVRLKRSEILKSQKERINLKLREEAMAAKQTKQNKTKSPKKRSRQSTTGNDSTTADEYSASPAKKAKKIKKEIKAEASADEEIAPDLKWLQDL